MKIISVISDEEDLFSEKLCIMLEKYGGAVLVSSKSLVNFSAGKPVFLVVSLKKPEKLVTENSAVIFLKKPDSDLLKGFSEKNTAVYFENEKTGYFENEISVGHSSGNNIIIASDSDSSAVLAVGVPLVTSSNNSFLPCEIKAYGEKMHENSKLLAALYAILIYFNIIGDNSSEIIF